MDIGRAFTYLFEDKDWLKKVAIGGLVTLIPIVNFITLGYGIRTFKNILEGQETPLPEWDDWGGDFMRGLIPAIAYIVYGIPIWILSAIGTAIAAGSDSGGVAVVSLFFSCLSTLYGIVLWVVAPAMLIRYAKTNEFASFYAFGEIIAYIKANLREYIVAVVMMLVAGIVAGIVGGILCGIGVIFTSFIATLVSAHLLAQVDRGAEPAVPTTTF